MTFEKIVENHLIKLKIKSNDRLVVHSNITTFGYYSDKLPEIIINKLFDLIGKNGNIVMPLYNIGIKNNTNYDRNKHFSSKDNGFLPIYFFKKYKAKRSSSIIHSHIIKGSLEKKFTDRKCFKSFGANSDFDFFKKNKFKLLLLGCEPDEGCSYIHHLEERVKVPYRKKIKLNFNILNKKKITKKIHYFARKQGYNTNLNLIFNNKILKKKIISQKLKYGFSHIVKIKDLDYYATKLLNKNKTILLT